MQILFNTQKNKKKSIKTKKIKFIQGKINRVYQLDNNEMKYHLNKCEY